MTERVYFWREASRVDDALLGECAALFSEHYGVWGASGPPGRAGRKIRLSRDRLRAFLPAGGWIVGARRDGALVGYALGVRSTVDDRTVDWVTQLVVHADERNQGVAKNLLFTFWGFSDHFAWGLVTSNPYAVEALERISWRLCDRARIARDAPLLHQVGRDIPYVAGRPMDFAARSTIDTDFHISHRRLAEKLADYNAKRPWQLGAIREGEEWLAFTFRDQPLRAVDPAEIEPMIARSERAVRDAYARMQIGPMHAWSKHTAHEVDVACALLGLGAGARVLDLGCGTGRHASALADRGIATTAVDFVAERIAAARQRDARVEWISGDARTLALPNAGFDAALCLDDVVGSFASDADNDAILAALARLLRPGGKALVSVMNLALTRSLATHVGDPLANPELLLRLAPGAVMQTTGQIFDPALFILDDARGVVYRKEQFDGDGRPPGEYIVRDRRYTAADLRARCERLGFVVHWVRPVALGRWPTELTPTDRAAKELLALLERRA